MGELIQKENIIICDGIKDKEALFRYLASYMRQTGRIAENREEAFYEALWERERQSLTGIGNGIAIPHAQKSFIKEPTVVFVKSNTPISYEGLAGDTAELVFMIAVPENASAVHLDFLARLSRKLVDEEFVGKLKGAEDREKLYELISEKENVPEKEKNMGKKILGVTACTTGIAHTYMAAENLEKAAKALRYDVKVETDGSSGVENELLPEEIKEAELIVVAADLKVEMARFHGKKVYQTSTAAMIKDADGELKKALQLATVYQAEVAAPSEATGQKKGIYSHLMNGVSNMIPIVVGGGILIAISFMFGITSFDPSAADYNQFAAWIKQIGDTAFGLMIPVLAGYVAYGIADRPGLAPGLVAGMLAYNGGAGFLGGLLGGFMAGYFVNLLKKLLAHLPKTLEGLKPVLLYPLISMLVVGLAIVVVINPVMSQINTVIADFLSSLGTSNKILLGFLIGAMLAVDLGGPINKAAYTFSAAMLGEGNITIMGACLASGMVPAIAIGVAALLFKKKFTSEQREEAKASIVLGLSFICEGAIPYAAADPKAVIPSLVVGGGVAGALAMLLGVGCPAPHGGIFVTPVITNILGFFVSILAGVAVTILMIRLLKKDRE